MDGTLETDALTIDGVSLAETIADTVGAMVGSNTETGITVTYDDSDNTLDFVVGTLNQDTTGNAATATALATARTINGVSFDGTGNITVTAAAGTLTGNTLASGVTASSLTSVGTLTGLSVSGDILMTGTGAIDVPTGTTAQRPSSPTTGAFRYNSTDAQFEGYTASGWGAIAGGGGGGASDFQYLALRNSANDGAASYPASDFTLVTSGTSNAISPTAANTLLVSIGGVIQQPNTGTSTPTTGFAISGSTIKFGSNISAAPDFIIYQLGAGIGTPSDNTITSAKIVDGAIVNADINASAAIAGSKINPNFVSQEITGGRLSLLDNGSTSPTLLIAGDDGNPWGIQLRNDTYATGAEGLKIFQSNTGITYFQTRGTSARGRLVMQQHNGTTTNNMIEFTEAGAVEIDHAGNKKFETTSTGVKYTGDLRADDDYRIKLGTSQEFNIYHHNSGSSLIENTNQTLKIRAKAGEEGILINPDAEVKLYYNGGGTMATTQYGIEIYDELNLYHQSGNSYIKNDTGNLHIGTDGYTAIYGGKDYGETAAKFINDGAVELYFDGTKRLETYSSSGVTGIKVYDNIVLADDGRIRLGNATYGDLQLYHNGTNSHILENSAGELYIDSIGAGVHLRAGDNAGNVHNSVVCNLNSNVELYYDNVQKFSTTSDGTQTTGRSRIYYGGNAGKPTLLIGADNAQGSTSLTNATQKACRVGMPHYTNAEEPTNMFHGVSGDGIAEVRYGGGTSYMNAATSHRFYTAANTTTTSGTERFHIDSTGALGVGITPKTNDTNYRHLQLGLAASLYGRDDDSPLYLGSNVYRGGSNWKYTANTTATQIRLATNITFLTAPNGTAGNTVNLAEKLRIQNTGGISFNGDTAAANALSDYEQGSWTPSVTSGITSPGYSVQYGRYTKVGNLVTIWFYIALNGSGTANSSHFIVSGLPYTVASTMYTAMSGYNNSSTSSFTNMRPIIFPTTTYIRWYFQNGTHVSGAIGTNLGVSTQQLWWGSYQAS